MLGVDAAVAAQDACRIEHVVSEETMERLREHLDKFSGKTDSAQ